MELEEKTRCDHYAFIVRSLRPCMYLVTGLTYLPINLHPGNGLNALNPYTLCYAHTKVKVLLLLLISPHQKIAFF